MKGTILEKRGELIDIRVMVAHPGQQHSYRLASALEKMGILDCYVTTVYNRSGSLTEGVTHFLKGSLKKKAQKRKCESIPDDKVIQIGEWIGLVEIFVQRYIHNQRVKKLLGQKVINYFGKRVARLAMKRHVDAVVSYDYNSAIIFSILKKCAPSIKCIMDVSAANRLYMKKIYEKDCQQIAPAFAERLKREILGNMDKENESRLMSEIRNSDFFIVPSDFVEMSLMNSGVTREQIILCPYGVDLSLFKCKEYESSENLERRPLEFIYVGGVKEIKGIYYLLEAFRRIPENIAKLTVVGNCDLTKDERQCYEKNVKFTGIILHQQIPAQLREADVFVFPSLGEGMSLSVLEAAASGLPLIISENSGIAEKMHNNDEGFVIPIQSSEAIIEKVMWFSKNRQAIRKKGEKAREMAMEYSWERYNKQIDRAMKHIFNSISSL